MEEQVKLEQTKYFNYLNVIKMCFQAGVAPPDEVVEYFVNDYISKNREDITTLAMVEVRDEITQRSGSHKQYLEYLMRTGKSK